MILKNKESSLKSFKQKEDNTQRSKQMKTTRFVFKLHMKTRVKKTNTTYFVDMWVPSVIPTWLSQLVMVSLAKILSF